jgi:hypothetical protein
MDDLPSSLFEAVATVANIMPCVQTAIAVKIITSSEITEYNSELSVGRTISVGFCISSLRERRTTYCRIFLISKLEIRHTIEPKDKMVM